MDHLTALEQRARERRAQTGEQTLPIANEEKESKMSDTKTESAWGPLAAGVAGLLLGENGVFGGNRGNQAQSGAVTPDQMNNSLNQLAAGFQRDQTQGMIAGLGAGNAIGHASIKDAITDAASQNALSLCNLGHGMSSGFAQLGSTVQSGFASAERLALQSALDAERARATELRIALSEYKNESGHARTQVLLNQVIAQGNP